MLILCVKALNNSIHFRILNNAVEMWLRSERISRRLRGRLSLSGVTASKATSHRTQVGTARKVPHIGNSSRVITSSRCGRVNQWRRRSSSFLKEVSFFKTGHLLYKYMIIYT